MTGSARGGSWPAGAGPETVRVVRPGHPLHGLDLPVWGRLRLRGVAMVVLVLPDGSRKRIPAAWAHEGGSEDTGAQAAAVVAAAGDLLRLLRVNPAFPPPPGTGRSKLHGSHQARRTTVQPAQLSLLPDQVPAPPSQLASQLPPPIAQAAAAIVTRLIIQAAQPDRRPGPQRQSRCRRRSAAGGERR